MNSIYVNIALTDVHGEMIELRGEKFHHLVHVRRLRPGASLRAALPDGRVLQATVTEILAESLLAQVGDETTAVGVSPCRITLFQAVLKGEKMELVIQKASELGVATVVPIMAKRSIPRWTPPQAIERAERWQRIAEASAEQCERSVPLIVEVPRALTACVSAGESLALLLHERQGKSLADIAALAPSAMNVGVFIGPEGGWEQQEVDTLLTAGVQPVHLGGRILRAETASLAAVTLVQYLWGDLNCVSLER